MNYLLKSSQPKKSLGGKILFFIVFVIVVSLFFTPFGKKSVKVIAMPFLKLSTSIKDFSSRNVQVFASKKTLIEENQKISEELALKEKDLKFMEVLKEENLELKGIKENRNHYSIVIAAVVSRPSKTPYDTLIVDSGLQTGISIGDRVMVDGDVFIGEVYEVSSNSSKVRLYSSPGNRTEILIGEITTQKEAIGMGAGNFKVELSKEIQVKEGDSVVIPSITANIFGVVEKIEEKTADSFKTVLFKSPVNIQEIRFVEILAKK